VGYKKSSELIGQYENEIDELRKKITDIDIQF